MQDPQIETQHIKLDDYMENKYMIIKLDCENYTLDCIGTFDEKRDALEYMALEITTDEKINSPWYQKIFESDDIISIFQCHYIAKKTIKYKYFIKHY